MLKNCLLGAVLVLSLCCKKATGPAVGTEPEPSVVTSVLSENFVKGADISWLTEMGKANIKFYNSAGAEKDLIQILKEKGMNTIRLRVWVNPADGYNNTADVLAKSLRAKALGMRILIDFHYSDFWADPGKQNKPAAWVGQNITQLKQSVYDHTAGVLTVLKLNGVTPEWVQVGNETNDGMLWEEGRASKNMKNFAELIQSGYSAVKAVNSTTKVMVHISNGYDNALFRWIFDGLKANGANWDVIGMSLYPTSTNWSILNIQCLANMNDMVSRYGKEVMICEVGMDVSATNACKAFLSDIILKTNSVAGKKGLGVLYWEPQAYNSWKGYNLGAFDISGKPTAAMDVFLMK